MTHLYERVAGSPVGWNASLGRRMRDDDLVTLGTSSLTLAERALEESRYDVAADLIAYQHEEMTRINEAVLTWLTEILAHRAGLAGLHRSAASAEAAVITSSLGSFNAGEGDLVAAISACRAGDRDAAAARAELMRIRTASVHDLLVWWTQHLLTELATDHGDEAVRDVVLEAYNSLWSRRYANWYEMDALERLQLSVEGMRGHLSGPRHRGDVVIAEDEDAYRMVLDPCGSCGVLRRGDPDSGRRACDPAGPRKPYEWTYNRTDMGWYAVHSAIVMEWLQVREGRPPFRPLLGCDLDGPCTWFVFKNAAAAYPAEPAMAALLGNSRSGSADAEHPEAVADESPRS
ncbi:hypothetical protein ACH4UM_22515 [Streptomyces sp. NPDC020801]|uniref:hypothetical protein n=1 Tax=unclassified Streptomyces TaxID=2593676 RepID=UPI0037B417A6